MLNLQKEQLTNLQDFPIKKDMVNRIIFNSKYFGSFQVKGNKVKPIVDVNEISVLVTLKVRSSMLKETSILRILKKI